MPQVAPAALELGVCLLDHPVTPATLDKASEIGDIHYSRAGGSRQCRYATRVRRSTSRGTLP